MKHLALSLTLLLGAALVAPPMLTPSAAEAAQKTQAVKKKVKPKIVQQRRSNSKTNFRATRPDEPNGAGISDFCAHTLEIYGRMGVGCNKYGRDFYTWDD